MLFFQIRVNSYFRAPVALCTYLVIYYLFAIMSPPLDCQLSKRILLISNPILYPQCLLCFGTKQVLNKCCTNKWSQSSAYLNPTLPSRPSSLYKRLLDHSKSRVITTSFELKQVTGSVTYLAIINGTHPYDIYK